MLYRLTIAMLISGCISCSHTYTLYLGPSAGTRYETGPVTQHINDDSVWISFLNYHTYRHQLLNSTNNEEVKHAGMVLKAKSVLITTIEADALFGTLADSTAIHYTTRIESVRNGRSAMTSVSNLFSKKADKKPQAQPDTSLESVHTEGKIQWQAEEDSFSYSYRYNGKANPTGWLVLNGDTLKVSGITAISDEKGNIKKPKPMNLENGLELVKQDTVYAALDRSDRLHNKVYLLKQLNAKEKDILAAYLFIVACYY